MHLRLQNISKSFGIEQVIRGLNLHLEVNRTLSILGTSGCGKTTLLKLIAGLLDADNGQIFLSDKEITGLPANKRNIVYINQEPLLFPHMNVFENIGFGLRMRKESEVNVQQRVKKMISHLGLEMQAKKYPEQLSGGQRQRVSFGRAIIINPPVLLLDEPFASLDFETRNSMQQLFKDIVKEFSITSIFVTHDLKEAILMADEIALMNEGTLKHYHSVAQFRNDPASGVRKEIEFWEGI